MRYFTLLFVLTLSACSSTPEDDREMTEARHYREAHKLVEKGNFLAAIEELEELEARFPYGDYTEQAQLELIYVRYRALDYPEAIAQAERFIRSYPAHPELDYALYLKGLANFHLDLGLFDRLMDPDEASRDLSAMRDAYGDFSELLRQFPDSPYAADARQRMVHIRNQLAAHELNAARYYARRQAFVAAANRAQFVIRHFQESPSVPLALAILSKAYEELDRPRLAAKSERVLRHNWPDAAVFGETGDIELAWWPTGERGFLSLLTFDLL